MSVEQLNGYTENLRVSAFFSSNYYSQSEEESQSQGTSLDPKNVLGTQLPSVGLEGRIQITHLFLRYLLRFLRQSLGATFDLW